MVIEAKSRKHRGIFEEHIQGHKIDVVWSVKKLLLLVERQNVI